MANKIRTFGPGSLTFGEQGTSQAFDSDATNVVLTPKADTEDEVNFLDGTAEAGAQSVSYTLDGTIKENYSADGIQAWAFKNQGKQIPFKFIPNSEGAIGFTGKALIAPLAVGGDVKKQNDQDFSFTATDVDLIDNTPEG